MKTNEGSCTIRENELPQLRPNDTNFAQTGASCSLIGWRYSESRRPFGPGGCSRRRTPEKEILFYTNEASMSMKTNEASCAIRENELLQLRPNDTNSAKTTGFFALLARSVQSLFGHRKHGERFSLRLSQKSPPAATVGARHGVPVRGDDVRIFIHSGRAASPWVLRRAAKIGIMSGARDPVRGGLI
jgi:hypothetical protein